MTKPRVLLIGDFACATGFGTVNETLLSQPVVRDAFDWHILGINASGDPHPLQRQFKIYPAALHQRDVFGVQRAMDLLPAIRPDLIVLHQDAWNLPGYFEALQMVALPKRPKILAWCPPDAPNQWAGRLLNDDLALLLTPTQFGLDELRKGGYTGRGEVLPYGVDTELFTPGDRRAARKAIGFKEEHLDDFIVGRADRNAKRKRYDLTIKYWAEWWRQVGKPANAKLLFHCAVRDVGYDLEQLAGYYGVGAGHLLFTSFNLSPAVLWPRRRLVDVYRAWDVHFSTTLGEGFGLVGMESAACGIPQVLPKSAAYEELFFDGGARFLDVTADQVHDGGPNTVGKVPDEESAVRMLDSLYVAPEFRKDVGSEALVVATQSKFQWPVIAQRFHDYCQELIHG